MGGVWVGVELVGGAGGVGSESRAFFNPPRTTPARTQHPAARGARGPGVVQSDERPRPVHHPPKRWLAVGEQDSIECLQKPARGARGAGGGSARNTRYRRPAPTPPKKRPRPVAIQNSNRQCLCRQGGARAGGGGRDADGRPRPAHHPPKRWPADRKMKVNWNTLKVSRGGGRPTTPSINQKEHKTAGRGGKLINAPAGGKRGGVREGSCPGKQPRPARAPPDETAPSNATGCWGMLGRAPAAVVGYLQGSHTTAGARPNPGQKKGAIKQHPPLRTHTRWAAAIPAADAGAAPKRKRTIQEHQTLAKQQKRLFNQQGPRLKQNGPLKCRGLSGVGGLRPGCGFFQLPPQPGRTPSQENKRKNKRAQNTATTQNVSPNEARTKPKQPSQSATPSLHPR